MVVSPTFKAGNKWRLSDGDITFNAEITDGNFLQRVADRQEGFFDGDQLRVVLRESQYTDSNGNLRTDREVVEVLDHLSHDPSKLFPDGDA